MSQKAGLGMRDALLALQKSEKNIVMRSIIEDLIQQISQGTMLGQAMGNHAYFFSLEEREMIASAESIGTLPDTLDRVALDLEEHQAIMRKIKETMTYPIVLIVITVLAVIVLLRFVIPTIVGLFPSVDDLPAVTRLMLRASDFL
ncbi:MAG: type II secretion system F family protein [Candidatus Peribacteria bacterium]|nr:MAG: type II secretion system F family protein [Candidatus Peribacteria bacterium]